MTARLHHLVSTARHGCRPCDRIKKAVRVAIDLHWRQLGRGSKRERNEERTWSGAKRPSAVPRNKQDASEVCAPEALREPSQLQRRDSRLPQLSRRPPTLE